jgi:hypothetical protein
MERQKALIASAIVAVTLMTGAVAFAAASGLTDGRRDNVGNLQPVTLQPTVTVSADPTAGSVTTTTTPPSVLTTVTPSGSHPDDYGDDGGRHDD